MKARPYGPFERELQTSFEFDEDTDPDDDVSFGYVLSQDGTRWVLRVSMVGPFALLMKLNGDERCEVISCLDEVAVPGDRQLLEMLKRYGIVALSRDVLESPMELMLPNTSAEESQIYQVLFTDSDVLPWNH